MAAPSTITLRNDIDDVRATPSPRRSDLMHLIEPTGLSRVHLQIHRNYAIELIGSVLSPFLWLAGLKPQIAYSPYDDSLSFADVEPAALQIISLDFERYGEQADATGFSQWFASRLENLRGRTEGPIVVSDWPSEERHAREFNLELEKTTDRLPSVFVWKTSRVFRNMGATFFDER